MVTLNIWLVKDWLELQMYVTKAVTAINPQTLQSETLGEFMMKPSSVGGNPRISSNMLGGGL